MLTRTDIIARAIELNLTVVEQSKFVKITKPGSLRAIYVAKKKNSETVTRLDVSGFAVDHPAAIPPRKHNGAVTAVVNPCASVGALEVAGLALLSLAGLTGTGTKAW